MRNYRSMNDEKLLRTANELIAGDPTSEAMSKGSQEDLPIVLDLIEGRGLNGPQETMPGKQPTARSSTNTETVVAIKPMLAYDPSAAHEITPDESRPAYLERLLQGIPTDGSWIMEPKLDGWRWQCHIRDGFVVSIGGRNGKEHTTGAAIADQLAKLPPGTVLDGELITVGGVSSDVARLDLKGTERLVVFDLLAFDGKDATSHPWHDRRSTLQAMLLGFDVEDPVALVPHSERVSVDQLEAWLDIGVEGAVCKRRDAPYRPGSRRRDTWLKIKPKQTTDAIVLDWELGKGQSNRQRCGALNVQLVETGAVTTVGYDSTPEEAQALAGRRIEVQHFGWQRGSGKVRHPGFVRLRPDLEVAS